MKTECYSVKLQALLSISDKCYKAVCFDGSEALIPRSQVFGRDLERIYDESEAWWISKWILEQKPIQYSSKKAAWFDTVTRKKVSAPATYEVITPKRIEAQPIEADESLTR